MCCVVYSIPEKRTGKNSFHLKKLAEGGTAPAADRDVEVRQLPGLQIRQMGTMAPMAVSSPARPPEWYETGLFAGEKCAILVPSRSMGAGGRTSYTAGICAAHGRAGGSSGTEKATPIDDEGGTAHGAIARPSWVPGMMDLPLRTGEPKPVCIGAWGLGGACPDGLEAAGADGRGMGESCQGAAGLEWERRQGIYGWRVWECCLAGAGKACIDGKRGRRIRIDRKRSRRIR